MKLFLVLVGFCFSQNQSTVFAGLIAEISSQNFRYGYMHHFTAGEVVNFDLKLSYDKRSFVEAKQFITVALHFKTSPDQFYFFTGPSIGINPGQRHNSNRLFDGYGLFSINSGFALKLDEWFFSAAYDNVILTNQYFGGSGQFEIGYSFDLF
ncbi:MAG: hypothetical protein KDD94_13745 [Calditrichaeota bacterium]|nr:hypothetical protein [Calditrichota bacterium]